MERNWAWECGKFMALSRMMRDVIAQLDSAEDQFTQQYLMNRLKDLAEQTDQALVEFEKTG